MPPEPSCGPRSTAWEGTSSGTTFTGWSGRSALCCSCWPCSSSLRGSSSYAATKSAWRTRRNGPCPAPWTSLSPEGNVRGRCSTSREHDHLLLEELGSRALNAHTLHGVPAAPSTDHHPQVPLPPAHGDHLPQGQLTWVVLWKA